MAWPTDTTTASNGAVTWHMPKLALKQVQLQMIVCATHLQKLAATHTWMGMANA